MDSYRCLSVLEVYGIGPPYLWFPCQYWGRLTMVAQAIGYCGYPFKGYEGVTQLDPLLPMLFNFVVYAVIGHCLIIIVDETTVLEGFYRSL